MRKFISTLVFLTLCFVGTNLSAQNYQSAIGLRLGIPVAVSYKFFINETSAIELYGSYRRWGAYSYHVTDYGLGATYQIHNDLSDVTEGLQWFYGGGAGVSFYSYSDAYYYDNESNLGISVHPSIGLDYRFADAPINVSLDWQPNFILTGYGDRFGAGYGALSVRYILGE